MLQSNPVRARSIEVSWVDMDAEDAPLARFWETLGADERARAERFRFFRDRRRFVVRRGTLRALLARRLDRPASGIRYVCNEFGKPSLDAGDLRFNLSHSHSLALYVIARGIDVGCDVERRDARFATDEIAARFFAPREVSMLRSLAPALRTEGFFNCWTRKEAYVKARGYGLSMPLDSFVVSLAPGEPAALLEGCEPGWAVVSIETMSGYHAALVTESADWRLDCARPLRAAADH
jgi:4'-phosphopantetheinyl transferase